jgi:putative ABC transport system permease protein
MVLIPTFGMTVGATLLRTGEWTETDRRVAEYGQAEAVAYRSDGALPGTDGGDHAEGRLLAAYPVGSVTLVHTTGDRIRTDDDRVYLTVSDLPIGDAIAEGRFTPIEGRSPATADETALTNVLAEDLGVGLGDRIRPQLLDRQLTVVGLLDQVEYEDDVAFVAEIDDPAANVEALIDLRPGAPVPQVRGWAIQSTVAGDPFGFSDDDNSDGVYWTYVGGAVALLVVGTVIAAAFAVGARRQLRSIGLLSAAGASPRTVRWFLLAQGVVGGALGSLLGVGLGVLATRLFPEDWVETVVDRHIDGPITRVADVLPILAIGTIAAVGAAWLPARSAARVPTLQALAGRRPQGRVPRRLPLLGALSVGAGSGLLALSIAANDTASTLAVLVAVLGSVAILVGTLAIGPWVIAGVERFSAPWPESARLAGRSLGRSRLRSSAVVGAICAVLAVLVACTTLYRTFDAEGDGVDDRPYVADGVVVIEGDGGRVDVRESAAAAADLVDGSEVVEIGALQEHRRGAEGPPVVEVTASVGADGGEPQNYTVNGSLAAATPGMLALFDVPEELRDELDRGAAIAVSNVAVDSEISLFGGGAQPDVVPFGGSFESPAASTALPTVLISEATAADLGYEPIQHARLALDVGRPITDQERRALELYADDLAWERRATSGGYAMFSLPEKPPALTPGQIRAIGYGVLMLLIGAVVAVGLALAAKDDKDEAQVLTAVGAPPRIVRRVAALRAGFLVGTAIVIAVPAGLLPAWAIVAASPRDSYSALGAYQGNDALPLHVDAPTLLFVVVVVPVAVMAVALISSWARDRLRRTRPLVFAIAD